MKIIMYGSAICPDCVIAREQLEKFADIELDYRNITENTSILKEFLSYRDHEGLFAKVIENGRIGIPFFILEDGTKTFELPDYVNTKRCNTKQTVDACSVNGKGYC